MQTISKKTVIQSLPRIADLAYLNFNFLLSALPFLCNLMGESLGCNYQVSFFGKACVLSESKW